MKVKKIKYCVTYLMFALVLSSCEKNANVLDSTENISPQVESIADVIKSRSGLEREEISSAMSITTAFAGEAARFKDKSISSNEVSRLDQRARADIAKVKGKSYAYLVREDISQIMLDWVLTSNENNTDSHLIREYVQLLLNDASINVVTLTKALDRLDLPVDEKKELAAQAIANINAWKAVASELPEDMDQFTEVLSSESFQQAEKSLAKITVE